MIEAILDSIEDEQIHGQVAESPALKTLWNCNLDQEFRRIVQWCARREQVSWPTLAELAYAFRNQHFLPGWNLLSHHLGAPDNPMEWDVRAKELKFIAACLFFTDAFPASRISPLVDFPLRRLCSDLLMSSVFHGCGVQVTKEWCSPEFYDSLLAETSHLLDSLPKDYRIPLTRRILGYIARLFETNQIPRLQVGIGAGEVYYGMPSAMESLERTLRAMRQTKMDPEIVAGVFAGVLNVQNDHVSFDVSAIRTDWLDSETRVRSPIGSIRYRTLISELRRLAGPDGSLSL